MFRWELIVFARAAALSWVLSLVGLFVTAATDEGGVAWTERVWRVLPATPVCAAVATALVVAALRRRGELRAFEVVGRSERVSALPAVLGGVSLPLVAALGLASVASASEVYYPALAPAAVLRVDGAFVDPEAAMRHTDDGLIVADTSTAPRVVGRVPHRGDGAAALTTALAGAAFALLAARSRRGGASAAFAAALVTATTVGTIVMFHAAAIRATPALAAALPSALSFGLGLARYASPQWR